MHGKLKFLHMANFFSTNLFSEVSDKYQVWSREVKMSTDNNMTQQTPSNILRQHLIVSEGVWECLFVSVGFCFRLLTSWIPWRCLGVSEGCSGGVSMGIWVVFMEIYSARMCLGVSGFSVLAVWSYNTTMTQPWKKQLFLIWPYWDITISKCLYIRLTKKHWVL